MNEILLRGMYRRAKRESKGGTGGRRSKASDLLLIFSKNIASLSDSEVEASRDLGLLRRGLEGRKERKAWLDLNFETASFMGKGLRSSCLESCKTGMKRMNCW